MHSPRFHKLLDKSEDRFALWAGTWDVEIAAVVFSCLSLIAMIVLLIIGNGQAVWSGVTLNTYVSILATATKLSALFALSSAIGQTKWNTFRRQSGSLLEFEAIDSASRGALGCIQLLLQTRRIALLGAVTFILAFAFDPFTQQLIQTKSETRFENSMSVTAPTTTRYSGGSQLHHLMTVVDSSSMETLLDPHVDYAMQASVLSGLVQEHSITTQQLSVACPSGNCTWDPFPSLGICNRCTNLEARLNRSVVLGNPLPYMLSLDSAIMIANSTRFQLPNGLYIENTDNVTALSMTTFGTGNPQATVSMTDIDTLIWSTTMLKAQPDPQNASATWPHLPVQALECALYYCVKQYHLTMTGNQIRQNYTELPTFKRQKDSWRPYRYSRDGSISWVILNSTARDSLVWDQASSINRTDLALSDQHQLFNISFDAVRSISKYFTTNFYTDMNPYKQLSGYYMDLSSGPDFQPNVMQVLHDTKDLEGQFDTLALSMSNAIRMRKEDMKNVYGQLGQPVTKYRIEWPWITMPIIIVLASLVQLLITMRSSRARPILKSSVLAVLSRGPYIEGVFNGAETVKDMRDAVSQERVCLFDMTEPMMSPHYDKKFSVGSSSYTALSSPEMNNDGRQFSPFNRHRSSLWADDSSTVVAGDRTTQTDSGSNHGLGIGSDESPLVSPRRAFLSSFHERSRSGDEAQESLLHELQETCHLFRSDTRGPR